MQLQTSPGRLPQSERLLHQLRQRVDEHLAASLPMPESLQDSVALAMREGTLAPGKRLRPLLLLIALSDLGRSTSIGIEPACALEMVHAASLFIDDLPCMDDASMRRGRPTIHLRFGEDVAVLASVALLSHAYGMIAAAPGLSPQHRNAAIAILARSVGTQGLVRGQFRDLRGESHLDGVMITNQLKTGSLFTAALDLAALLSNTDAEQTSHLRGFASQLGLAYQLLDDVADGLTPQETGKDCQQDIAKTTVVSLLGPHATSQQLTFHRRAALCHLQAIGLENGLLAKLVHQLLT